MKLIGFPRLPRLPDCKTNPWLSYLCFNHCSLHTFNINRISKIAKITGFQDCPWLCCQCLCLLHFVLNRLTQKLPNCQDSRISILSFYNMLPTLPGLPSLYSSQNEMKFDWKNFISFVTYKSFQRSLITSGNVSNQT